MMNELKIIINMNKVNRDVRGLILVFNGKLKIKYVHCALIVSLISRQNITLNFSWFFVPILRF